MSDNDDAYKCDWKYDPEVRECDIEDAERTTAEELYQEHDKVDKDHEKSDKDRENSEKDYAKSDESHEKSDGENEIQDDEDYHERDEAIEKMKLNFIDKHSRYES